MDKRNSVRITKLSSKLENDQALSRPALSPENREAQLEALAYDLAEKQLREGTASSQVISHFLKMGSEREKLEKERIRNENDLAKAKIDSLHSQARSEELYANAIKAMKLYKGNSLDGDDYNKGE